MAEKDFLKEYRAKRKFDKTSEPFGEAARDGNQPIFVIQKHEASRLHYDFRLEVEGVLKSWAVPKGPSTDPDEKRLAVQTEDHPLEYADFEGIIPQEEYGGGTVEVWDAGTYRNLKENKPKGKMSMLESLENGIVSVFLEGKKLKGGYTLIRLKNDEKNWLLFKMKDKYVDKDRDPVKDLPESVLSGKTIEQISKEGE